MKSITQQAVLESASVDQRHLQHVILEQIALNHPTPDILSSLCVYVEHIVPGSVCSVMLLNERTGVLTVGAVPTGGDTACTILDGLVPGEFSGACGTAVHTKQLVIIEDTETDIRWEPIREIARPLGIKSCWSIPILINGDRVVGTFAISHRQSCRPTSELHELLETASYLAGVAIQRKTIEDERRASECRYRDLYESAPLAYITSSFEGKILTVNQQVIDLLGFSREELIGRSVIDLYAPNSQGREKAQRLLSESQDGGEISDEELLMQRRDESQVWISLAVRLIQDAEGRFLERRVIITDISSRKQTEALHRLQRAALESIAVGKPLIEVLNTLCYQVELIVPHSVCSVLVFDPTRTYLTFHAGPSVPSSLVSALDGMTPGSCAGSCGTATYRGEPVYVHNTATDPLWVNLQEIAQRFQIGACWSYPIFAEGKQVLGSFAISSVHPQAPTEFAKQLLETASYLAGIAIQRRRTEEALTESELRYRLLYEDNPSMYFTVALDGTILSVNHFGAQQLGYTPTELLGQPVTLLFVDEDRVLVHERLQECVKNGGGLHGWEFRKIRKDGTRIWVRETARLVKGFDDHDVCLMVCEEITSQKYAEEQRRQQERAVRDLYEITSSPNTNFDQRVQALLELGRERFQLPFGLLTCRDGDQMIMQYVASTDKTIAQGLGLPLCQTYCQTVMTADEPLIIEHAAQTEWAHHPAYQVLPLEAYLGTKVEVENRVYGTLCFTGFSPYHGDVTEADRDFLQLMARWIGGELERQQAQEALRLNEQAIRELHEITASADCSFEERVRALLNLGCRYFRLPIGMLTHRLGDELEVQYIRSSDPAFQEGLRVPIEDTFCCAAMFSEVPIGFEHAAESEWKHHGGYRALGLECYLGTRVLTGTEAYGTFCFISSTPYSGKFSKAHKDFLQLMAKWVGTELERIAAESTLQSNLSLMNTVLEGTTEAFFVKDLEGRYLMMNVAGRKLLGKTSQEVIGKTDAEVFPVEIAQHLHDFDQAILASEHTHTYEEELVLQGEKRSFLTTKGPYRDTEGRVIGLFGNARDITKRKEAEEKLKEIHLALSHAMPGIAQLDLNGTYIEVNDFYASMLGYDTIDLIEKRWERTVHPDDLPLAQAAYQSMLDTGKGEFEAKAIRQDGSTFFKQVLMVKRVNADGKAIGHHCFMRDVTERREAEETLRSIIDATSSVVSTDFFRSLLKHIAAALKVKYALITECIDSTNTRVRTLAFLQGEAFVDNVEYDLAGTPCEHVIHGEFSCHPRGVQALYPEDQDLVTLNAESYIGLPLEDSSGAVIGHIAILNEHEMQLDNRVESLLRVFAGRAGTEVERHRAETALRRSEGRLRQIIDLVPHFIFAKDQNGTFILANQAVADVYGTTLDNLIGKTDAYFNPSKEEIDHFRHDDAEVLLTGEVKCIQEEKITDAQGNLRFLQTTKIPFVFADTTLPSLLGISIDITKQREAKAQLEVAYEQLQEMTSRLKAAEESERKRIARELHDEFGQALTGLKFDVAWCQRRLSEPAAESARDALLEKIEAMSTLTDHLIHMVRRIATSLRPSILDDLGFLPALEWHIQDFQQRTGITCTFLTNFGKSVLALDNDRATALFRITQELFTNILRHAKASEVKISLAQQNQSLILSLEDNGQGIQDDYRSSQSPSLGLLGIKERVMSLGGEFIITGKVNSGTHAKVSIPLE